ncbi:tyrosine-type recombinase/integrase [Halobacteriovorax sp. GFR7]|uniref:tyrosine-type recombinase/integrase n=1 Tax=unclassified Halobacteriovorax TaxID=2639665 RepID=UPI003D98E9AD
MNSDLITGSINGYQLVLNAFLSRRAPQTQRCYRQRLKLFFKWASAMELTSINQINHLVVEQYINSLENKNLSYNTINTSLAPVKKFFEYLYLADLIPSNSIKMVRPYKIDRRAQKTKCPSKREIQKTLQQINTKTIIGERDFLIILIFVNTGIRRQELRDLKIVDIKKNTIMINGKGQRKRNISISNSLKHEILKYINNNRARGNLYIFNSYRNNTPRGTLTSDSISRILRSYAINAKVNLTPHMLRVYFATEHYKKGTPISVIQRLMGHETINQTQRYIELIEDEEISKKYITNEFLNQ